MTSPGAMSGPARPAVQAKPQSTLPCGVGMLPCLMTRLAAMAVITGSGSSPAAARPGGYSDGAEDATTVPSAAIATTAVTAWSLWTGPVIAGTASVPSGADRARPGCAGWPGMPSTVPAGTPPG